MEPTSEQELKQLLDEGRITEEEYRELLEVIRQKEIAKQPFVKPEESKPRTGYGKAALILMIAGIMFQVPGVLIFLFNFTTLGTLLLLLLGIGGICEVLAFIFGIIGWKSTFGKIVVIGVPCTAIVVPFLGGFVFALLSSAQPIKVQQSEEKPPVCHKAYSLDSLEGVLTKKNVQVDNNIFAEGTGALKIEYLATDKRTIRLFETGPMGVENRRLIYSAKIRVLGMPCEAYLEMWCDIPGKGEFFSRGIEQSVMGTTEWTTVQITFHLETGQIPDNVKLNLVTEGPGTVWIDDIKLSSSQY